MCEFYEISHNTFLKNPKAAFALTIVPFNV